MKLSRFAIQTVRYVFDWFLNPARARTKVALPTHLSLPVTDNCNARCIMCDVWKDNVRDELTSTDYRKALGNPLFRRISHVGISGGEPTLRKDLPEIIDATLNELPNIQGLSITTHGFHVQRLRKLLPIVDQACRRRGVAFKLNVSLDGPELVHNQIRRVPNGYQKTRATIELAQNLSIPVQLQFTASSQNVFAATAVRALAIKLGVEVVFRKAVEIARLDNSTSVNFCNLSRHQESFFSDFLLSKLTKRISPLNRNLFYANLTRQMLKGESRKNPCYWQREGVVLCANGDLYHCSISKVPFANVKLNDAVEAYFSDQSSKIRANIHCTMCPKCEHDQMGAFAPTELIGEVIRSSIIGDSWYLGQTVWLYGKEFGMSIIRTGTRKIHKAGSMAKFSGTFSENKER